jgi:hypothetical protein
MDGADHKIGENDFRKFFFGSHIILHKTEYHQNRYEYVYGGLVRDG